MVDATVCHLDGLRLLLFEITHFVLVIFQFVYVFECVTELRFIF